MSLTVVVAVLFGFLPMQGAAGQGFPPGVDWFEMVTPHFRVVFPSELDGEARRVGELLEEARSSVSITMDARPSRLPVVLNNRSITANGYVALAPRRSVWEGTPFFPGIQSTLGTADWYSLLARHELRHVAQLARMNRGMSRILRIAFGDYGRVTAINMAVPAWFTEGDAVGIETSHLSAGGRGRIPAFDIHVRAMLREGRMYRYPKLRYRSSRDYVPGIYPYGYLMTTHIRRVYGSEALSEIAARSASWSAFPLAFPIAVKTVTGRGLHRLQREAMSELDLAWREQREGLLYTQALRRNTEEKNRWVNLAHPSYVSSRGIVAVRSDMRRLADIVRYEPGSPVVQLGAGDPSMYFNGFDANPTFAVWAQSRSDPRFSSLSYSVIMRRELDTGNTRALTRRSRLWVPSISPDGVRVAAVSFDIGRASSVVVIDAWSGDHVFNVQAPDETFVSEVDWTRDGNAIVVVAQDDDGKSVYEFRLDEYAWRRILGPTRSNIWGIEDGGRYLFYVSDHSGIDNIYALDRESGGEYQVTSRPLGAYFPAISPDGERLAFADYTVYGFDLLEQVLDPAEWRAMVDVPVRTVAYFEPIADQERERAAAVADIRAMDSEAVTGRDDWPIRPYRRLRDAVHLHSWLPTIDEHQLGLALLSSNLLGSATTTLAGLYDRREQTFAAGATATFSRYYPVVSVNGIHGGRTSTYTTIEDGPVHPYSWLETGGRARLDIPLRVQRGNRSTAFGVAASGGWFRIDGREVVPFLKQGDGHLASYGASASFSRRTILANADFLPSSLQSLYLSAQQSTGRSDYHSRQIYGAAALAFRGIGQQHRIRFTAEAELERPDNYRFTSILSFSRGYSYRYADNLVRASAGYAFPAGYPDLSIGNLLYVPRLVGEFFYDHTWGGSAGSAFSDSGTWRSVGFELSVEFYLLSYPRPVTVGVRALYRIETADYRVEPALIAIRF